MTLIVNLIRFLNDASILEAVSGGGGGVARLSDARLSSLFVAA